MQDLLKDVSEMQRRAKSCRKKGDALRKVGREDPAREAYRDGVAALNDGLEMLRTRQTRSRHRVRLYLASNSWCLVSLWNCSVREADCCSGSEC